MTDAALARPPHPALPDSILRANALMAAIPYWFVALIARIPIAAVFWRSGQTKVEGWRSPTPRSCCSRTNTSCR